MSAYNPWTLQFASAALEEEFWGSPAIRDGQLSADKWALLPVFLNNMISHSMYILKHSEQPSAVMLLVSAGMVLYEVPKCCAANYFADGYLKHRYAVVLGSRLLRALMLPLAALQLDYRTPPDIQGDPARLAYYLYQMLLVGTFAVFPLVYAFQFPLDYRSQLLLAPLYLPGPLIASGRVVAHTLREPLLLKVSCELQAKTVVTSPASVLQPWLWRQRPADAEAAARARCMETGPLALYLLFALYFGCVVPIITRYLLELRDRALYVQQLRLRASQAEAAAPAAAGGLPAPLPFVGLVPASLLLAASLIATSLAASLIAEAFPNLMNV